MKKKIILFLIFIWFSFFAISKLYIQDKFCDFFSVACKGTLFTSITKDSYISNIVFVGDNTTLSYAFEQALSGGLNILKTPLNTSTKRTVEKCRFSLSHIGFFCTQEVVKYADIIKNNNCMNLLFTDSYGEDVMHKSCSTIDYRKVNWSVIYYTI